MGVEPLAISGHGPHISAPILLSRTASSVSLGSDGGTLGSGPKKERRVTRDRLVEDLRWLAEGNPKYASASEEGQQNIVVAHLMADDFLLSYIDDQEITELFYSIHKGYSA